MVLCYPQVWDFYYRWSAIYSSNSYFSVVRYTMGKILLLSSILGKPNFYLKSAVVYLLFVCKIMQIPLDTVLYVNLYICTTFYSFFSPHFFLLLWLLWNLFLLHFFGLIYVFIGIYFVYKRDLGHKFYMFLQQQQTFCQLSLFFKHQVKWFHIFC